MLELYITYALTTALATLAMTFAFIDYVKSEELIDSIKESLENGKYMRNKTSELKSTYEDLNRIHLN